MKLKIERTYVDSMLKKFPNLTMLEDQLWFGNHAEVTFSHLSVSE